MSSMLVVFEILMRSITERLYFPLVSAIMQRIVWLHTSVDPSSQVVCCRCKVALCRGEIAWRFISNGIAVKLSDAMDNLAGNPALVK